jgi:formylmethanofuran dehydrogenase subunit A
MGEVGRIALVADSQDAGAFTAYPDALRFIIAVKRRRDPCRRDLLLQECGPLPAQIRRGTFAEENGWSPPG